MNGRSVSKRSAGRGLGKPLATVSVAAVILLLAPRLKAGEVIFTITGTLYGGSDSGNFFGLGRRLPEGTPFTAVATFDDTKAHVFPNEVCPGSESSIRGGSLSNSQVVYPSAGTVVVTINGRSMEFGKTPTAGSQVSRYFHCWCNGMPSKISILIMNGVWMGMGPSPYAEFAITVEVPDMSKGTTWSTPGTFTKVRGTASMNMFSGRGAGSSLNVESIVVTRR